MNDDNSYDIHHHFSTPSLPLMIVLMIVIIIDANNDDSKWSLTKDHDILGKCSYGKPGGILS